MFRRLMVFLVLAALFWAVVGAVLATGMTALAGPQRLRIVLSTIGVIILLILLVPRRFRGTWRGVRSLIDVTGRLADGDYEARVGALARGPLAAVGRSFNKMAERLEDEDDRRRRLLADLSHELRAPLSVIRGQVEAMLDGVHTPDSEHLRPLLEEVAVMDRLLEDLRTLTLAEAGRLELHREPTDLTALVEDVLESYGARAREQGVEIVVEAESGLAPIEADPVRLREVVSNLVVNALRYMADGGTLTASVEVIEDRLVVHVGDSGPGIDPERIDHIFDRFAKSADSTGSGLGLTIARDLVEAHGGRISARNLEAGGAEIRFELPAG